MVAGASKLEEVQPRLRFQIIPSPERNPDAHEILSPPPRRFWPLKAGLAAVLMASAVVGFLLAALFLGSIIAAVLMILVVTVSMVVAIKAVIRHVARIRDKRRRSIGKMRNSSSGSIEAPVCDLDSSTPTRQYTNHILPVFAGANRALE